VCLQFAELYDPGYRPLRSPLTDSNRRPPPYQARSLGSDDRIALEATGNALAIATARIIESHVGEVVPAHARKVRAIAEAKVKAKAIDACAPPSCSPPISSRACGSVTSRRGCCAASSHAGASS
jgi:hypothetical protein